jgi:ubiquinone/menaquinone biosynthesis C-methylase UbiE
MKLTNRWNRFIYRLWAPIYDVLFDRLIFVRVRRRLFSILALQSEEWVLLVGIGTGADLPFLPAGISAVGLDLSPDMLAQAQAKISATGQTICLIQADAQRLPLYDQTFDAAVLSLVLSVVPEAKACWQETMRVLRPGSRAMIFDKFLADNASPSWGRRLLSQGAVLLGTDINRRFGEILSHRPGQVVRDEPSLLRGAYRIILVCKQ